eukprot:RCo038838
MADKSKTPCRYFSTSSGCRDGSRCPFKHGSLSFSIPKCGSSSSTGEGPSKVPCKYFNTPLGCRNGTRCQFIHGSHSSSLEQGGPSSSSVGGSAVFDGVARNDLPQARSIEELSEEEEDEGAEVIQSDSESEAAGGENLNLTPQENPDQLLPCPMCSTPVLPSALPVHFQECQRDSVDAETAFLAGLEENPLRLGDIIQFFPCASRWVGWFRFYQALQNNAACHSMRVIIMAQTLQKCREQDPGYPELADNSRSPAKDSVLFDEVCPPPVLGESSAVPPKIEVWNMDCVKAAIRLQNEGCRPCVLNMASATSPGGGFQSGDGAQEENLHYRSDYFRATANLLNEESDVFYPLPEIGGIYSPRVAFFRGVESEGYPMLPSVTLLDCIAVAAIRHPKLTIDPSSGRPKFALPLEQDTMQRKVNRIFAVPAFFGNNALVLGAFGCGAFLCPAEEVARMFLRANEKYGHAYQKIVVAIVSDHNTINKVNNEGLFAPFCRALRCQPFQLESRLCPLEGVCDLPECQMEHPCVCPSGGTCPRLRKPLHRMKFHHPPMCKKGGLCCQLEDKVHRQAYSHVECRLRGLCARYESDEEHRKLLVHPPICPQGNACTELSSRSHIVRFLHPQRCPEGGLCARPRCQQWHLPFCPLQGHCEDESPNHLRQFSHVPYCTETELNPSCLAHIQNLRHKKKPCERGLSCSEKEAIHYLEFSHLGKRFPCRMGSLCTLTRDKEHMNSFSHLCWYHQDCRAIKDPEHCRRY